MNGADFYALAEQLSAGSKPAEMRSAISRAYYGAFHRARELLVSIGIVLPKGPECHTKIPFVLENAGDADIAKAGSKLSSLRAVRNDADYALQKLEFEQKKTVVVQLQIANQIILSVESCFSGQPKAGTHAAMRDYAKDVLRLTVS